MVTACVRLALLVPLLSTLDVTWAVSTPTLLISVCEIRTRTLSSSTNLRYRSKLDWPLYASAFRASDFSLDALRQVLWVTVRQCPNHRIRKKSWRWVISQSRAQFQISHYGTEGRLQHMLGGACRARIPHQPYHRSLHRNVAPSSLSTFSYS